MLYLFLTPTTSNPLTVAVDEFWQNVGQKHAKGFLLAVLPSSSSSAQHMEVYATWMRTLLSHESMRLPKPIVVDLSLVSTGKRLMTNVQLDSSFLSIIDICIAEFAGSQRMNATGFVVYEPSPTLKMSIEDARKEAVEKFGNYHAGHWAVTAVDPAQPTTKVWTIALEDIWQYRWKQEFFVQNDVSGK
jgi:hypothetical protein